jgi:hypothetical protein
MLIYQQNSIYNMIFFTQSQAKKMRITECYKKMISLCIGYQNNPKLTRAEYSNKITHDDI